MSGIIISGSPRSGKSTLVYSLKKKKELLSCNVDAKISRLIQAKKIRKNISLHEKIKSLIGNDVIQDSEKKK